MKFAVAPAPAADGLPGVQRHRPDRPAHRRPAAAGCAPGDIAVIDHLDLDRATAEALRRRGVVAVVNASPFISGRYPNLGPSVLAEAGVVMVDDVGHGGLRPAQGRHRGPRRTRAPSTSARRAVASGARARPPTTSAARWTPAAAAWPTQLESFTHNTTEFLRREQELLLHGQGIPTTATAIAGRAVVVVVALATTARTSCAASSPSSASSARC